MSAAAAGPQPIGVVWYLDQLEQLALPASTLPATFGEVARSAVAGLARAMGGEDPATVQRRLDTGRRCFAARRQDQLAAYGWVSFAEEHVGELGLHLRLLPHEAYIWDCATLPDYRRQGLYANLLGYIVRTLWSEGVGAFWIGADTANQPSQAGIARAGFTAVTDLVAAPPQPGEQRRRAWLHARPGISPSLLAKARRAYLGGREEVWLFEPR